MYTNNEHIVIFDGICNFCNGAINFIIKHDPDGVFVFTPMQSELAKSLILKYKIDNVGIDTFLLIKNDTAYIWTDAALEIAKDLNGYWYLANVTRIIPRFIRDYLYRVFARNRYRLFGKRTKCMVPTPSLKKRFIGI
jgi:predicted DCC family thiol-disulfide oxidoreductase YuxK